MSEPDFDLFDILFPRTAARLRLIITNQGNIMSTLAEVKASEAALITAVTALIALADAIKAQLVALIAAGGATPDDLQAVKNDMDTELTAVQAALANDQPPAPPAPAPAP